MTTERTLPRDLMDAEILAMWPDLPLVHRFLLATGQPLKDIVEMDWSDIDEETGVWRRTKKTSSTVWDLTIPEWVLTWLPKSSMGTGVFLNADGALLTPESVSTQLDEHVSSIGMEAVTTEDIRNYVRGQMTELGNAELAGQVVDQAFRSQDHARDNARWRHPPWPHRSRWQRSVLVSAARAATGLAFLPNLLRRR